MSDKLGVKLTNSLKNKILSKWSIAKQLVMKLALNKLSITQLTLLGFSLVALPLVMALLFSVNKLNKLAQQSTQSIYYVAQLSQLSNILGDALTNTERSASQYLVLKDDDLYNAYNKQQLQLTQIIKQALKEQQDDKLIQLLLLFQKQDALIKQNISQVVNFLDINSGVTSNNSADINVENSAVQNNKNLTDKALLSNPPLLLSQLQQQFKQLVTIKEQIKQRSNVIINRQARSIDHFAKETSENLFNSLFSIPITLLIAIIFILLITRPLKRLIDKINTLEQGDFQAEIKLEGTTEVIAIAEALETMRQRLHSLELQKSSFIRHISHELKTPLAAIREGTELIYDHSVGSLNDDQQEICKIIKNSVNRLQRLIEDLLNFNIVLDSTSLIKAENTNINHLINSVIEQRKLEIKRKNLNLKLSGSIESLHCNATQLNVVLDNLLSNAIKYAPVDSTITIEQATKNEHITLSITDKGAGISLAQQAQVFDAFYQGTPPENSQIKGSGLGLTIVKELVMRLHGDIKVESPLNSKKIESCNSQGTSITVTLPNTAAFASVNTNKT